MPLTFRTTLVLCLVSSIVLRRNAALTWTQSSLTSCFVGLVVWLTWRCYLYPFYVSPLRHIPTVPGFPLWGQGYERVCYEICVPERQWHIQYGPVIRYFLPFGNERVSIADDEAIKDVTVREPYKFVKPQRVSKWMGTILGKNGILLVDGDVHMRQRKALTRAFSATAIRELEPTFWEKGLQLARTLKSDLQQMTSNDSVEILEYMNRATLDVIGSSAFGYEIGSLQNPDAPLRKAYSAIFAFDGLSVLIQGLRLWNEWARHIPCQINRDMLEAGKVVKSTADKIIESKLNDSVDSKAKDIIGIVVRENEALDKLSEDRLSFEAMRDQIATFLGAGHDTSATGVAWTLLQLAKHPDIQDKLRQEIISMLPDIQAGFPQDLSKTNVDSLPYLSKVLQESLRIIPPIPTTVRVALADTHLAGYTIPAGTMMYISSNVTNHLPCYWGDDADRFDPERWDRLPASWVPNAYQTFLVGPRGCIGRKFAETEMKILLCCLVAQFQCGVDKRRPNPEETKMWRLVLRPKDGIWLNMSEIGS